MTSRLQLHLSARDLKNMSGLMGRSDPFAVVTVRGDDQNNKPRVVGQTEVYVCACGWGPVLISLLSRPSLWIPVGVN